MRARKLLDGAWFGGDALKAIGEAFDAAWTEIADNFTNPVEIEATRLKLANALLSVVGENSRDVALHHRRS